MTLITSENKLVGKYLLTKKRQLLIYASFYSKEVKRSPACMPPRQLPLSFIPHSFTFYVSVFYLSQE